MNDDEIKMATLFAELSEELSGTPDGPLTFQRVVDRALEVVPGCDHCGLHLRKRRGRAESASATDDIAAEADRLQDELQDGPCVDAAFQSENFIVHDVRTENRWPSWAERTAALGIRSSMSVRLTASDETIGALNFYSDQPGTFDGDQDIAMIFSSHAAAAMANARLVSGLRNAMDSRHSIGMAQGVLAVRYGISYERAFQVLHRYSNDHNIKLRDLADIVLQTRKLPDSDNGS
ncbi:MAG: GAF and ANTAR domain-containing protein [Actinomycetota bacterium]|nr:GAF and ANTAR domain-containing protein [Actinomycetota bacterium]